MDLSQVMFVGLLLLIAVVGIGWVSIFVDCINAILIDRDTARKHKTIEAYNAKIAEIEARKDGVLTPAEIARGWHYCPEFDGLLTIGEVLGGDQCICVRLTEEELSEACYARLDATEREHDAEREARTGDKYL